jgi:hypothetical protein
VRGGHLFCENGASHLPLLGSRKRSPGVSDEDRPDRAPRASWQRLRPS